MGNRMMALRSLMQGNTKVKIDLPSAIGLFAFLAAGCRCATRWRAGRRARRSGPLGCLGPWCEARLGVFRVLAVPRATASLLEGGQQVSSRTTRARASASWTRRASTEQLVTARTRMTCTIGRTGSTGRAERQGSTRRHGGEPPPSPGQPASAGNAPLAGTVLSATSTRPLGRSS
jgi:hypothetical protein